MALAEALSFVCTSLSGKKFSKEQAVGTGIKSKIPMGRLLVQFIAG